MLTHVVDRAEIRMVEARSGAGLPVEAVQIASIRWCSAFIQSEMRDLKGHPAMEFRVVDEVDGPHRPLSQPPQDSVAAEPSGQLNRGLPMRKDWRRRLRLGDHLADLAQDRSRRRSLSLLVDQLPKHFSLVGEPRVQTGRHPP